MADAVKTKLKIVQHGKADNLKTPVKATENGVEGVYYIWNKTLAKDDEAPLYAVGVEAEFNVENKPYNGADQLFLWRPKGGGNRGGGAGVQEASKAKNAIIEKTSASKNASINYAANLKSATTCLELAVSTLGADQDLNAYRERAFDLYQIIQEVATIGSAQK